MPTIPAIVMTCDKYRFLTDHMMAQYERLWPDHPFQFRIPYQDQDRGGENSARRLYMPTSADIKLTVLSLLEGFADDDWVYWCIDDQYPIRLDVTRIANIVQWIPQANAEGLSGVLYCRCRNMYLDSHLTGVSWRDHAGAVYLGRKDFSQFWLHQFMKAGVIRYVFNQFPTEVRFIDTLDAVKDALPLPEPHQLAVSERSLGVFGESTRRGQRVTVNCAHSLREHDIAIPPPFVIDPTLRVIMGDPVEASYCRALNEKAKRELQGANAQ